MLTFKFRIYPDKDQQAKLWKHANQLNWLYNYFLNMKIQAYKAEKKSFSKFDLNKILTGLKNEHSELKEIHSQVLRGTTDRLDKAYKAFFRRVNVSKVQCGFPRFRSCKDFFGICYPQPKSSYLGKTFKTKIYGEIRINYHCKIQGNVKQIYITTKNDKWFCCVTTDYVKVKSKAKGSVGIDIGLKDLVVTSDGQHIKNTRHAKYFDKQIAKVQSKADEKKKGSRSNKFLTKVKQKLYDAKVRKITDFQHKVSKTLSSTYDTIYAEDLNSKKMSESKWKNLNKALRNARLARLLDFLSYKTNKFVLVNPKNTSKTCNFCGHIHKNLKLSDRTITCICGKAYDRDENAAKNVYCLGQAVLGLEPKRAGLVTIQEVLICKD